MTVTIRALGWALAMSAAAAMADAAPDGCTDAQRAAPAAACRATGIGVVLGPNADEVTRMAAHALAGEARFRRYFGAPPPRWALMLGGTRAQEAALRGIGIPRALPFPTGEQYAAAAQASIARGAEAQARAQGLTGAQLEAVVATARQRWAERNPPAKRAEREAGVVPHELGHLWLIERFWPGAAVDQGSHYGGPGPDWLDETAAVLMEDDVLTASRRTQFAKGMADDPALAPTGVTRAALLDLRAFLTAPHPMAATQANLRNNLPRAASGVRILTGDEALRAARGAVAFYLQARMFADWAIAVSGDEKVFGSIAIAMGRGERLEDWLRQHGRARKLGGSVDEVIANWQRWAEARHTT